MILAIISELEQKIEAEQDPNLNGDLLPSNIMILGSMLRNFDFEANGEIQALITRSFN